MTLTERHKAELLWDGFTVVPAVADAETVALLPDALSEIDDPHGRSVRRRAGLYGIRNLLDLAAPIRDWACSEAVLSLITPVIGTEAFPVRATLFDKTPEANWSVTWHRALSIAVQERRETPVPTGGALLMRPLLLHASSDACSPDHRRVVHLDFAAESLPGGLRWHTQDLSVIA